MNNRPRNSLDYSHSQLEQFSDDNLLEVLPAKADEDNATKYVLIKHDFYSTDSDFGRQLLKTFLNSLCRSSYNSIVVYLIDKGTKLLDKTNPLYENLLNLSIKAELVIADRDSIDEYGVDIGTDSEIPYQTSDTISEDVICLSGLLVLE